MIKRYDAFVKGKVNEEFIMAEPKTSPSAPEVAPGTTEKPGTMPQPPSPIRRERISPVPAPAKMEVEPMEEEGSEYMGGQMLQNLANALGTEVVDNSVEYNGKKINFYSETEMFHVDKKKFKTVEEVVDYLESSAPAEETEIKDHSPSKEDMDELMAAHDEDDFIKDEEEEEEKFESKSYKSTRKFESFKNKKK